MEPTVVPFGKYKGRPIELMLSDREYCDWAKAQPWFRERYAPIYQIIVEGQPSRATPEHNQLQARFLDDDFCVRVVLAASPHCHKGPEFKIDKLKIMRRRMEVGFFRETDPPCDVVLVLDYEYHYCDPATQRWVFSDYDTDRVAIEIEPTIGDEYPDVLRKMLANQSSILVVGEYSGSVAQHFFEQIFRESGIRVVMMSDLDARSTDQDR